MSYHLIFHMKIGTKIISNQFQYCDVFSGLLEKVYLDSWDTVLGSESSKRHYC